LAKGAGHVGLQLLKASMGCRRAGTEEIGAGGKPGGECLHDRPQAAPDTIADNGGANGAPDRKSKARIPVGGR
jgi:hypothetical protein